jgi:hypothetical protein
MGRGRKLTKEIFIEKANKIHNNKYDYSKVKYVNYYTKVIIICPIHGEFLQTPNVHLFGHGCRKCANNSISNALKYDINEFIELANKKHNNVYNYDKVIYINNVTKIIITCPIHGDFTQIPRGHLNGQGCPKCNKTYKLTQKIFIKRANKLHKKFYNYDKFIFINVRTKGIIICPIHGEFLQTPNSHINNNKGCPGCGIKKYEETIMKKYGVKYIFQSEIIKEKSYNTTIERYGEIWLKHCPRYNSNSIIYLDLISEKLNISIQHALNGGEKKFVRYYIDGYISEYNICIEWNEQHHNWKKYKENDLKKKLFLEEKFNCKIIYINEKEFLKDVDNQINVICNKIKEIINN